MICGRISILGAWGVAIAVIGGGAWYYTQPRNYDECMLAEMRGQQQSMYWTVEKVCSKRFNREFKVSVQAFSWHVTNGMVDAIPVGLSSEYAITKAVFQFSSKGCSVSTDGDYSTPIFQRPDFGHGFKFQLPYDAQSPVCMRQEVWGRYR